MLLSPIDSRGSVVAEFVLLSHHLPSLSPQEAGHRLQQRLQQVMTSPGADVTASRVDIAREWGGVMREGDAMSHFVRYRVRSIAMDVYF